MVIVQLEATPLAAIYRHNWTPPPNHALRLKKDFVLQRPYQFYTICLPFILKIQYLVSFDHKTDSQKDIALVMCSFADVMRFFRFFNEIDSFLRATRLWYSALFNILLSVSLDIVFLNRILISSAIWKAVKRRLTFTRDTTLRVSRPLNFLGRPERGNRLFV